MRVGGKNPKNVWWNNEIKAAVRRKEVLAASNEEKIKVKRCVYQSKKKVNMNSLEGRWMRM